MRYSFGTRNILVEKPPSFIRSKAFQGDSCIGFRREITMQLAYRMVTAWLQLNTFIII